jgi:hypothetical protein
MSQQGRLTTAGSGGSVVETLTGNSGGAVGPDASFNINIVGNTSSGINVIGTPGTSTLTIVSTYYSLTPFIVGTDNHAEYATIQSAITAATAAGASSSSPANVYIKPGTYTENITLADGVNLVGFGGGARPSVIINGKCSGTFTGACSISGVALKTNGDFALSLTGANSPFITLDSCYFISTLGQTTINITTTGSSILIIHRCSDFVSATSGGNALFNISNASSASSLRIDTCLFTGSTTSPQSTIGVGGHVGIFQSTFGYPIITAAGSTTLGIFNSYLYGLGNALMFDINGTAGSNRIFQSNISSGSATAVTIGAGSELEMSHCNLQSDNAVAMSGAGILKYAFISFIGTSSNVTVATQTAFATLI